MAQTAETRERVEKGEIVEIASIDADFVHIAEDMVGSQNRLGEQPPLLEAILEYQRARGFIANSRNMRTVQRLHTRFETRGTLPIGEA